MNKNAPLEMIRQRIGQKKTRSACSACSPDCQGCLLNAER